VIKLIRFASRDPDVAPDAFAAAWLADARRAAEAPPDARPVRAAVGLVLPAFSGPADGSGGGARHDAVGFAWFADAGAVGRFQEWHAAEAAGVARAEVTAVVARELVARGAGWLAAHAGGGAFRHVALARRAAGLTRTEFSRLWAAHAGQVTTAGAAAATVIPAAVRGEAYVQNHPLAAGEDGWAYDAVNEVHFDRLVGLRARVDWFRDNPLAAAGSDLFGPAEFLALHVKGVEGV
jgi:hypothetical protein